MSGALISQIGNKDLTWEKTFTTGVGIDVFFFQNRLTATLDFYVKNTSNILYQVPVTGLVGVTSIWKNIGKMRNTGVELTIGGDIIRTKDLHGTLQPTSRTTATSCATYTSSVMPTATM